MPSSTLGRHVGLMGFLNCVCLARSESPVFTPFSRKEVFATFSETPKNYFFRSDTLSLPLKKFLSLPLKKNSIPPLKNSPPKINIMLTDELMRSTVGILAIC